MTETKILDKNGKELGPAAERKKDPLKTYRVKWEDVKTVEDLKAIFSVVIPQVNFNFSIPGAEDKFKSIESYLEEVKK